MARRGGYLGGSTIVRPWKLSENKKQKKAPSTGNKAKAEAFYALFDKDRNAAMAKLKADREKLREQRARAKKTRKEEQSK